MSSRRWASLEKQTAEVLGGRRIHRVWFEFESAPDVEVPDFNLIVDAKAYKRFAHHTLIETVREKYCACDEIPVLVTKAQGQRGAYATIPLSFLAELLSQVRDSKKPASHRAAPETVKTKGA